METAQRVQEKVAVVQARVEDLTGLYIALKKASFAVRNVAASGEVTYVYLEPWEEKDPEPLVLEHVGRPALRPKDGRAFKRRNKELKEAAALEAKPPGGELAPVEVLEPDPLAERPDDEGEAEAGGAAAPAAKEGFKSRLLKFWKFLAE